MGIGRLKWSTHPLTLRPCVGSATRLRRLSHPTHQHRVHSGVRLRVRGRVLQRQRQRQRPWRVGLRTVRAPPVRNAAAHDTVQSRGGAGAVQSVSRVHIGQQVLESGPLNDGGRVHASRLCQRHAGHELDKQALHGVRQRRGDAVHAQLRQGDLHARRLYHLCGRRVHTLHPYTPWLPHHHPLRRANRHCAGGVPTVDGLLRGGRERTVPHPAARARGALCMPQRHGGRVRRRPVPPLRVPPGTL
jgi:hypothetical protein